MLVAKVKWEIVQYILVKVQKHFAVIPHLCSFTNVWLLNLASAAVILLQLIHRNCLVFETQLTRNIVSVT